MVGLVMDKLKDSSHRAGKMQVEAAFFDDTKVNKVG